MPTPLPLPVLVRRAPTRVIMVRLALAFAIWVALYVINGRIWEPILHDGFGLDTDSRVYSSLHFFFEDSVKLLLLLVGMIFVIGMLRTTINPERVRNALEGRRLLTALLLAAVFGAITPFCSCSSIPLFIGFVAAGIPLSVTLTFLIASPLVNEVAVVMLGNTFGWGVTGAYVASGLGLAVVAGLVLSRFNLRPYVADFVLSTPTSRLHLSELKPDLRDRVRAAWLETRDIVSRVWVWILIGVGVGAAIHGWVPTDFFVTYAGPSNPAAVPIATLAGVPLYSNAAGVVPIAQALFEKGVALGTVMSFMMATVALSLPEFMLLRKVLKPRLLFGFFGIVTFGIMLIGWGFNLAT